MSWLFDMYEQVSRISARLTVSRIRNIISALNNRKTKSIVCCRFYRAIMLKGELSTPPWLRNVQVSEDSMVGCLASHPAISYIGPECLASL